MIPIQRQSNERTQTVLTLCLSADETAVYAVTSRGVFSAWSVYQSGQRLFEHRLDDPYFAQGCNSIDI